MTAEEAARLLLRGKVDQRTRVDTQCEALVNSVSELVSCSRPVDRTVRELARLGTWAKTLIDNRDDLDQSIAELKAIVDISGGTTP